MAVLKNKIKVSLDTNITGGKSSNALHSRILGAYFDNISDLFNQQDIDLIKGRLRNSDLKGAILPSISSRLDEARRTNNMSVYDFKRLYQFSSFFKKLPETGDEDLCKGNAYKKLLAGEVSCNLVNRTIQHRLGIDYPLFDRVKVIIQEVLGDLPTNFLDTDVNFGPGSSVNVNKRSYDETALFYKLSDKLVVPKKAAMYLAAHLSSNPRWVESLATHYHTQRNESETYTQFCVKVFDRHFHVVDNESPSRIGFVPKNADEHRTIGIEMNGLMPLQKVVGDLIRDKLVRVGINLNSQQRNRHLAKQAQTFGLATIDLANASNSISLELVRALLPYDWFQVISDFRSSHGHCPSLPGSETIQYEMVSSMGNGFTFELESLIFYALAKACAERVKCTPLEIKRSVSIFGDDIIVPQCVASTLIEGMSLFGFTVNIEKSFLTGYFYESCGADYYDGIDVRPFLIKRQISTLRDLFFVMNSLVFKAIGQHRDDYISMYGQLFKLIPDKKLMGPLHFISKEKENVWADSTDDLEAILRVPLDAAQASGAVKFDTHLYAWRYKKWIRVAIEAPISKSSDYFVKNIQMLTVLKGINGGKVLLRGRTKDRQVSHTSSNWNGMLTSRQLRIVKSFFDETNISSCPVI